MPKTMVQISSGHGPVECERGVCLLARALLREFPELVLREKRLNHFFCGMNDAQRVNGDSCR